jgi:hypothetical protein
MNITDKGVIALGGGLVALVLSVAGIFAQVQSGSLNQANNSGVTGTYRFEAVGQNQTRVTVNLQGLEAGTSHAGHFHQGTCNDIGPITITLNPIRADDDGRGTMTTVVDSSLQNIYSGNYLVAYHQDNTNESQSIACATIPARTVDNTGAPITPIPNQAPSTGLGGLSR